MCLTDTNLPKTCGDHVIKSRVPEGTLQAYFC